MKKLLSVLLVSVLVVSFLVGVMATEAQAKKGECYYYCDGIYWMQCCPGNFPHPTQGGQNCWWTGTYCA
ncbi:MAG: hypothetical protein JSW34_08285 [Candidatus Zixiibacteriota bacterium]|nr:MAG: hypothetical protein JSW34_08285 [candidate division Zixibacteria bacterium]